MKKICLLILLTFIVTGCTKYNGYCEICNYKLRSIDSYLSQYTKFDGSLYGSHFLGTGSIFGTMSGESYSTSNIFCVIEDNTGNIQIKTIPSKKCDIKIINDSTKRKVIAYRAYKIIEDDEDNHVKWYLSASSVKDLINNNYVGFDYESQKRYDIKFKLDTLQYLSNGKAKMDDIDTEYEYNHNKYDLSNDCTYYVFYVLEKDIITLSELK